MGGHTRNPNFHSGTNRCIRPPAGQRFFIFSSNIALNCQVEGTLRKTPSS